MTVLSAFHLASIVVDLGLGIGVYRTNPRRPANQFFLVLSSILALWLLFLALVFAAPAERLSLHAIRWCHSIAALFPLAFDWLRLAILFPEDSILKIIRRNPVWLAVALGIAAISQTPWVVERMYFPVPQQATVPTIPEPVFGVAFSLYPVFFLCSLGILLLRLTRSLKSLRGIRRAEMNYVLLGAALGLLIAFWFVVLIPLFTEDSQTAQLGPVSVIVLDAVIAYGIATRRIMDMAYVFRTVIAYALLTGYLCAVYFLVWWPLDKGCAHFGFDRHPVPHLLAALTVAFSLAPTHGRMQRFASHIFVQFAPMDVSSAMHSTGNMLRSISTGNQLILEFANLVAKVTGTDRVMILLAHEDRFIERYPADSEREPLTISKHSVLPRMLETSGTPIVPDVMERLGSSPAMREAFHVLGALQISVAVGMRSPEGMEGILLLGPKLSGRIYGAPDQQGLQLLCNQLAIALNNTNLYTEVQNAKIYNDLLVDNLASGVIAADAKGTLTVANREALRIVKRATRPTTLSALPPPLANVLSDTLHNNLEARNQDIVLPWPDDTETPVRVSSSRFYDHAGHAIGAFLVMSDLTAIRQLELQVRRTDRLASIGTLAAGMAHEIKNPLVSIKTFTQLLPERYEDPDFRETFTSLVGSEVKRIDTIVNQLLRFSRPAKPVLVPTHLHEVLAHTTRLLNQQLRQKDVRLQQDFLASRDLINADAHQLGQALVNLFLNAIEAMEKGGELTLTTFIPSADERQLFAWNHAGNAHHIVLTIQDTGGGIDPESLPHIFDPFFTTKSQGTGLGLSVAHGIITEHNGMIDVKSEKGVGTTFTITLQLLAEEVTPS